MNIIPPFKKVHKQKSSKATGESIILCTLVDCDNMLVLFHLSKDREIIDRKCYSWFTEKGKKLIRKSALSDYKVWHQFLSRRITDFEGESFNRRN